jgi:hypothetical protein
MGEMDHLAAEVLGCQKNSFILILNFRVVAEAVQFSRFAAPPVPAEKGMEVASGLFEIKRKLLKLWVRALDVKFRAGIY